MNVVLLAGGNSKQFFKDCIVYKSLAVIAGKPMVRWVAEAFDGSESIDRICVIGPKAQLEDALSDLKKIEVLDGSDELLDNIEAGLRYFEHDRRVMIASADIPMITEEMVTWLAHEFESRNEDFIYPIISKAYTTSRFPNMRRTYVHLREGEFTGGNISCVRPAAVFNSFDLIAKLIKYRKRPDKTASLLGMRFVMGLVTGRMTIPEIEKRVYEISGITAVALKCPFPEVGSDVDSADDLPLAENELMLR
ncbi:MAG TPA: nucleotidyltransferase family protein [Clostridia bacterium]|nr:nucleotidyltransferase family protein [Clostridia bacterium]